MNSRLVTMALAFCSCVPTPSSEHRGHRSPVFCGCVSFPQGSPPLHASMFTQACQLSDTCCGFILAVLSFFSLLDGSLHPSG